jgi:hypothetical protein
MIELIVVGAAGVMGYMKSRDFVVSRLRYVDRVQRPSAPLVAGAVAAAVALPVVAVLPVIGAGTALVFGGAVAMGTKVGAARVRNGYAPNP